VCHTRIRFVQYPDDIRSWLLFFSLLMRSRSEVEEPSESTLPWRDRRASWKPRTPNIRDPRKKHVLRLINWATLQVFGTVTRFEQCFRRYRKFTMQWPVRCQMHSRELIRTLDRKTRNVSLRLTCDSCRPS
jgi:hypothetical protein